MDTTIVSYPFRRVLTTAWGSKDTGGLSSVCRVLIAASVSCRMTCVDANTVMTREARAWHGEI